MEQEYKKEVVFCNFMDCCKRIWEALFWDIYYLP